MTPMMGLSILDLDTITTGNYDKNKIDNYLQDYC